MNRIKLSDEQKRAMRQSIHDFYLEELGEDIGLIRQGDILNLFMEQLAPVIYDKALEDAKYWFKRHMDDLEGDFYSLYQGE